MSYNSQCGDEIKLLKQALSQHAHFISNLRPSSPSFFEMACESIAT